VQLDTPPRRRLLPPLAPHRPTPAACLSTRPPPFRPAELVAGSTVTRVRARGERVFYRPQTADALGLSPGRALHGLPRLRPLPREARYPGEPRLESSSPTTRLGTATSATAASSVPTSTSKTPWPRRWPTRTAPSSTTCSPPTSARGLSRGVPRRARLITLETIERPYVREDGGWCGPRPGDLARRRAAAVQRALRSRHPGGARRSRRRRRVMLQHLSARSPTTRTSAPPTNWAGCGPRWSASAPTPRSRAAAWRSSWRRRPGSPAKPEGAPFGPATPGRGSIPPTTRSWPAPRRTPSGPLLTAAGDASATGGWPISAAGGRMPTVRLARESDLASLLELFAHRRSAHTRSRSSGPAPSGRDDRQRRGGRVRGRGRRAGGGDLHC